MRVERGRTLPRGMCHLIRMALHVAQLRVLGALIEKEIATPEGYPLSLNSLVAACNQRSSRDPVMELTEEEVRQALHSLEDAGLTAVVRDSRVAKYEHRVRTVWNLRRDETAVLCLLFLRGPQTPGELRSRADRLYSFDDLEAVQSTLERMASRPAMPAQSVGAGEFGAVEHGAGERSSGEQGTGPLVAVLARQPGSREARWAHLLGGPVGGARAEGGATRSGTAQEDPTLDEKHGRSPASRISDLEAEVAALRKAVDRVEAVLDEIRTEMNSGAAGSV
jgi:uncharacterized protein YceH (UPF0502 family)